MSLYVFNNHQKLIKVIRNDNLISLIQEQELNKTDSLYSEIPVNVWRDLPSKAFYMAVKDPCSSHGYFMYKITQEVFGVDTVEIQGINISFDELKSKGFIKDRRFNGGFVSDAMNVIVGDTDWQVGYLEDNLPRVNTNFYYTSRLEALSKLIDHTNIEVRFRVEISGNRITSKRIDVYKRLSSFKGKRFALGSSLLEVVKEEDHAGLYTALVGRGKGLAIEDEEGEETGGFERKLTFADQRWTKSSGDPVDKPVGEEWVEMPEMTGLYGYPDGSPRLGFVEFSDIEDPKELLEETYKVLQEVSRPKVQFKAVVETAGDMELGETVAIISPDFRYKTRVFKVKRNLLDNHHTEVEFGDKLTQSMNERIQSIVAETDAKIDETVNYIQTAANGKNKIFRGPDMPTSGMAKGDLWYRPVADGEYELYQFDGDRWELIMDTSETTKNADAIAEQQQEIEDARQVADEAVEQIDTAVANAGFTSLDDTLQNMNYITMNAEQNAQQAITNASNAYGLAQTSISEAQTAQANSLTALGKADNALDGVSDLDIRVDEVESELTMKADNTFMNEDGTLTTLSNAITFNAHRFSSDMSRIESRVESLAGEINLVILKDAIKGKTLGLGDVYPNPSVSLTPDATMREMIKVTPEETLALTKEDVPGSSNYFRINYYDSNQNYVTARHRNENQFLFTIPSNVHYIWVSFQIGSKPQLVRGEQFIPYRPNIADQMTADEMVLFRNQYDEFADRTERRLTAVDSSGGRLDVAENLITQTANGLTLKADQSTVDTLAGTVSSLGTDVGVVAGQISSKVWMTDIDDIEIGGRNLFTNDGWMFFTSYASEIESDGTKYLRFEENRGSNDDLPIAIRNNGYTSKEGTFTFSGYVLVDGEIPSEGYFRNINTTGSTSSVVEKYDPNTGYFSITQDVNDYSYTIHGTARNVTEGRIIELSDIKLEKGNKATDWTPAPEDTDAKISHVETVWTQTFEDFEQTITGEGGINTQLQTLDNTMSSIADPVTGRLSIVEQTTSGLQTTVASKASQSQVTQLANGLSSVVNSGFNRVYNPNFNEGEFGWTSTHQVNNVDNGQPTTYYGGNNTRDTYNEMWFDVSQGEVYNISVFAWISPSNQNGNRIGLHVEDKMGVPTWIPAFYFSDHEKKQREGTVTIPSGSVRARFWVSIDAHVNLGAIYWTNVKVTNHASYSQITQLSDNINLRVSKGDVISQINIEAERTLIQSDKLLLDANNVVFTGTAWIPNSVIGDLEADKITSGRLDAGQITVVNLDVSSLSGNTAEFITASFNGINEWMHLSSEGIHMSGSGLWRRTYLSPTGFDLYNDHGGNNKAGTIGYFKEHYDNTAYTENYFATTKNSKHYIGIGANQTHHIAFGYQDDLSISRKYKKALQIDGDTGRIRIYSSLSSTSSNYELNLTAYDVSPDHGIAWERSNSGIMFANSGTKIWDESANAWDDYNMTSRRKIGFYGNSGIEINTSNNNMDIWAGGQAIKFYVGTNELRFQVGGGAIQAYTDIGMNGNIITGQSDERLKTNIRAREELIINKLKQFNFVDFDWIESGKSAFGLIAQQVQKFAPELVSMDETNMLTLNNTLLNMYTTKSVVEINQKVDDLTESTDDKIHKLQQELSKANRRIEELEGAI